MTQLAIAEPVFEAGVLGRADAFGGIPPTPRAALDTAVDELKAHKDLWARLYLRARIALLDQILADLYEVREDWTAACIQAKGVQGDRFAEAEEWAMFAYVLRAVRLLGQSLRAIQRQGRPQIPGPIARMPNGQVKAQVFPVDRYDSLAFRGMTAEVWMEPGQTVNEVLAGQARFYRDERDEGRVVLVLGAGNTGMAVPFDFLYKLFVEGQVVIVKMNPVNAYLGPVMSRAFRTLIAANFLRIVYGGAEEGGYLCRHADVDELHMTGSDKTFEAIVFGTGAEGARRKAERRPLIAKRFTCELGCVSPVIVVPGPWTAKELDAWGEKLARWLVINAGFNCVTPRVILQWAGWPLRERLNEAIARHLALVETRPAYYSGAAGRHEAFLEAHPGGVTIGPAGDGRLPWTLISGVDPANTDDICFRREAFCSLMAESALEADDAAGFLETAVRFANDHIWGNLAATLVVHPSTLQEAGMAAAVETAVAGLRYGMVLINQYAGLGIFAMTMPWGAYPGNDLADIQSGIGVNCNCLMFARPQKTVVRNPFLLAIDPLTLHTRTGLDVCRRLVDLQVKPELGKVPGLLWYSIRS